MKNMQKFIVSTLVLCACLLYCVNVKAEPARWSFYDIKLSEIARISMSQLNRRQFVLDDALLNDVRRVSVELDCPDSIQCYTVLLNLFSAYGYSFSEVGGVLYVRKISEVVYEKTFIYSPKFRDVAYLHDALGTNTERGFSGATATPSTVDGSTSSGGGGATLRPNFSGVASAAGSTALKGKQPDLYIVRGAREYVAEVSRLVELIDKPQSQIEITVNVFERSTSTADNLSFAASFAKFAENLTGSVGTAAAVGSTLSLGKNSLQMLVSFLKTDANTVLVSAPTFRVASGKTGKLLAGAQVPVLGGTTNTNGAVIQSVTYQNTGLSIEVRPVVLGLKIQLYIAQSVSEAVPTSTGVAGSPTLTTREFISDLELVDGEEFSVVGLTSSRQSDSKSVIPWFPRLSLSRAFDKTTIEYILVAKVRLL